MRYAASNAASSRRISSLVTPRRPSTTRLAQSKYSRRRARSQLAGGRCATSRRLQILSASLTSFACVERAPACSICRRLRSALGSRLSSVTSATILATRAPNASASSSGVVAVSSTVSCSSAAHSTSTSVTPPSFTSTSASAIGWLMYGDASGSLRRWSRCLCAAKASALRRSASSLFMVDEALEDQDHRADADRRIGDVERRPVPAQRMEVEKIDDVAEAQAVDQVAQRAAEDQRQAEAQQATPRVAHDEHADDHRRGEGEGGEQRRLPARPLREQAEGRALVEHQHQVEEPGELLARVAVLEVSEHQPLGELVGADDGSRQREPAPRPRHVFGTRLARAGCSGNGRTALRR